MDSMFAIATMPDWIPADIRRASLREQIHTELSPQELEKVAATEGITVEELKKSEDFDPYFNLKIVLVEEGGQLKVAYSNSCRRRYGTEATVARTDPAESESFALATFTFVIRPEG